nr:TetR/AcrR family transcriptional regulator [Mangrovicoccus sp. HB161399]
MTPEAARQRALDIAVERIRTHGFAKLRLADVARDMGVSHAALYAHFSNKAALLDAVTGNWLAEARLRMAAAGAGPGPAEARIEAWFLERYRLKSARAKSDPEVFYGFMAATTGDRPVVRAHLELMTAALAELLAEAGLGGRDEAEMLEDSMAAFLHPALITSGPEPGREAALRRHLKVFLAGLAALAAGPGSA